SRYQKAKKGRQKIRKQLNKTKAEIEYCQNLLYSLENSDYSSLEEVKQEMIEAGYLREKAKDKGKRKETSIPQPHKFESSTGHPILVGRNNRQNDYITFKAASRHDTWFHAREIPGGHVVLKETPYPPPEKDIEEAAFLAAYFSRGKDTGAVDIDYTEIRHVRRRPGGKPGFVFYENFNTVTANPSDLQLRKQFGLD
ncbi:MAG: NFACT RNA binding domain-containing protein, partial [Bacillota bacterium]